MLKMGNVEGGNEDLEEEEALSDSYEDNGNSHKHHSGLMPDHYIVDRRKRMACFSKRSRTIVRTVSFLKIS